MRSCDVNAVQEATQVSERQSWSMRVIVPERGVDGILDVDIIIPFKETI